jgi:hypothetical protein
MGRTSSAIAFRGFHAMVKERLEYGGAKVRRARWVRASRNGGYQLPRPYTPPMRNEAATGWLRSNLLQVRAGPAGRRLSLTRHNQQQPCGYAGRSAAPWPAHHTAKRVPRLSKAEVAGPATYIANRLTVATKNNAAVAAHMRISVMACAFKKGGDAPAFACRGSGQPLHQRAATKC